MDASSDGLVRFPCGQCGARLSYQPGTRELRCVYCGHVNPIAADDQAVSEQDFAAALASMEREQPTVERMVVRCDSCAAEVEPPPAATAFPCPYCGIDIVATARSQRLIKPHALLPFKIERRSAIDIFEKWLAGRWFAPGALKHFARLDHRFNGIYLPAWTYDCDAHTPYSGQRGDNYTVMVPVTRTINGKTVTQMQPVVKVRWTPASGAVDNTFDDVLVLASHTLPDESTRALEPWDLSALTPYRDEFLSGFRAESYKTPLAEGFEEAKGLMRPTIVSTIHRDIGGDHQRIDSMHPRYSSVTFKHILLPVWLSVYRYREKTYRFIINARTGELRGQRPYSAWKITLLVLAILAAIGVIVFFATR